MVNLLYLGTDTGLVLKTIAVDDIRKWTDIRDHLRWDNTRLQLITKALKKQGLLEETNHGLKIDYDLWLGYKAHFGDEWAIKKLKDIADGTDWKTHIIQKNIEQKKQRQEKRLVNRYKEWIKFKPQLKLDPNNSHIYLTSGLLDDLLKDQIASANSQILVVNPYVEKCNLSESLITASERGISVLLIARSPDKDRNGDRKRAKIKFHDGLRESKVELYYNESVHAKMFIIDNQVLASSSMNLYSESTAGKSWESGIVSIDLFNVNLARDSFIKILNDRETVPQ